MCARLQPYMREAATLCARGCNPKPAGHEGARLSHVFWQHEVWKQGRVAGVAASTGPSRGAGTRGGRGGGGGGGEAATPRACGRGRRVAVGGGGGGAPAVHAEDSDGEADQVQVADAVVVASQHAAVAEARDQCAGHHCGPPPTVPGGRPVARVANRRADQLRDPRAAQHHAQHHGVPACGGGPSGSGGEALASSPLAEAAWCGLYRGRHTHRSW